MLLNCPSLRDTLPQRYRMKIQKTVCLFAVCAALKVGFSGDQTATAQADESDQAVAVNTFSESKALESLLIVEGMGGAAGTGFLTEMNGRVFAVTNLHVISAFGDPKNPNVSIRTVQNTG